MMRRLRGATFHMEIVGRARLWFILSGLVILVSLGSLLIREVNAGLEFRGGTSLQFLARSPDVTVDSVRGAAAEAGAQDAVVQRVGDRGFLVQTAHLEPAEQERLIQAMTEETGVRENEVNVTDVGPKWGQQITNKAIRAFIVFLLVAAAYMAIRLEFKMAIAAQAALLHDLVVTAGIYSLSGFVVTPATVIAILTILGFSLYDTVVIFDRIKERTSNISPAGAQTYSQIANASLNEVFIRSVNTSITSLLPVGSLLFVGSLLLGAETLRELALALFVGMAASTYSSLFVASPILAIWKEREPRWKTLRARVQARGGDVARASERGREAARPADPAGSAVEPAPVAAGPSEPAARAPQARRPQGQPPKRRKKKRRKRR